MNFTREPIIETIISPKDGYKLCVRNSRGASSEEHFVDAVEVISFGKAFFFRSLERPKAFLVPVTDYEVLEVKETRVALKNVSHERNIKIGGGREAPVRTPKEPPVEKIEEAEVEDEVEKTPQEEAQTEVTAESRNDKKRDRRRHRRRRLADERREWAEREKQEQQSTEQQPVAEPNAISENVDNLEEQLSKSSAAMFGTLFPPPPTLISETIARYKEREGLEGVFFNRHSTKEDVSKADKQEEEPTEVKDKEEGSVSIPNLEENQKDSENNQ
ncbi:MAG: hypothetical protein FJZ57_00785 [Chlamydiae bacterium]|nr:hypothetical protein [Chlamydiota bacterium]